MALPSVKSPTDGVVVSPTATTISAEAFTWDTTAALNAWNEPVRRTRIRQRLRSAGSVRAGTGSVVCRRTLLLVEVTVGRLHRALVQALDEMDELDVRLDVRTARSQIVRLECLCRDHL